MTTRAVTGPTGWGVAVRTLPRLLDAERLAAALPTPSFWLDSARAGYGTGRFSYLGAASATTDDAESWLATRRVPRLDVDLPFQGGLVGVIGYEGAQTWLVADRVVALDHERGVTHLVAVHGPGEHDAAEAWVATEMPTTQPPAPHEPRPVDRDALPLRRDRDGYRADVQACLERLRRGDSYEICLTNEVRLPARADDLALYRTLRRANPAPYAALLRLPDRTVLSSSPELFLRVAPDGRATSKPIKGTCRRHRDHDDDAAAAAALRADPKTRAENLMIVDLVRNDLSRVGTDVRVDVFLGIESYATVHQCVSTISARLRAGTLDAVRACFPPGSMTGAPKPRTMQIIAGLEQRERGDYSGALGWLGLDGTAELSVVIRTAVRRGDELTIGAGGAVVLDSDPDAEVAEMLDKAWATARGLA